MCSIANIVLSCDNVKRLETRDAEEIEKLTLKSTNFLFGHTPVRKLLDSCFLSLGIYNDSNQLSGVLCLDIYPNIPALPPWDWEYWLQQKYDIEDVVPLSTLWIHYAAWDRRYTLLFLNPILQNLYQTYEFLETVIMVCPPGIARLEFIDTLTERILPRGHTNPQKVQTLFVAKKKNFVANYVIRKAVEEDNDDLVSIIPKIVKDYYGPYYISEILSNEESLRQICVAEYRGCAVGVLVLNEAVNYELLNEEFELVPFNGLKKRDVADTFAKTQVLSTTMLPTEDSSERLSIFDNEESNEDLAAEREEDDISEDDFSLVNLSSSLLFNLFYDDEDIDDAGATQSDSITSIESHLSAVILNEEYADHLYYDRGVSEIMEEDKKLKRKDSAKENNIPNFVGEPNAFLLEICTSLPEHENCLYSLFQAAFECFPDRDYLVVSFPTDSNVGHIVRYFARVIPRPNSTFNHELYVLHKSTVLGNLSARVAIPEDIRSVKKIISSTIKPSIIEEMLKEALEPTSSYKAYTFLCERQIIGCAIVSEEEDHEYLELHFDISSWMDTGNAKFGNVGCLEQFLLSPIFHPHLSFFTRELHRLSNFSAIFYRLKRNDYFFSHRIMPIVNALINMIPLLPNPIPEYSETITNQFQLPEALEKHHQPFALYLSTVRLNSMIRVEVNHRIVVVGAGTTTISFLEGLIFGQNPRHLIVFTNVTVVSPHGIAYHKPPSTVREMVFVGDGHIDRRYMDSICLKTYVHVVTGVMTSINRKERFIGLNDEAFIPYDYLFLLCGEQFQKPPTKKKEIVKKKAEFPQNVFIINTEADAGNAFNALKSLTSGQKQGTVVVFGHCLEACCCLAALLEFGVSPNNLVYVDPSPDPTKTIDRHDHLTQFFNNSAVETAVIDEMLIQGMTIYQDYNFVEWHYDSTKTLITSAKFESKYKFVDIELTALFIYHSKGVSMRTFQAIAKSGLVFNGRLVIDKDCQTNDPRIYGAGPLTMYSKRYHSENLMHKYFNAAEVGIKLGLEMRRKLVPSKYWDPITEETSLTKLHKPVVKHCRFPGNLHYLDVSKPGQPVPLDVATIKCNYGRVLTTGDCKKLNIRGYFRLHLNQYQTVETITCLAKSELPVHNLMSLWGKHEILLNHLLLRYDLNTIIDFYEYFDQPWASALYHPRFPKVLNEIAEIFSITESREGVTLIDEVRMKLEENDWNPLLKMQFDEIEEICRDKNILPKIENKVLSFLHDNFMYLPMYAHQLLVRWIIHQIQTSPLFVKINFFNSDACRRSFSTKKPLFQAKREF